MKLEDVLKQDFSRMTPQQRSHLRRRLLAAKCPIPPELDLKRGQSDIVHDSRPDNSPWKATVVVNGIEHVYHIGGADAS